MAISVLNMLSSSPMGTQVALILLVDRSMDEKHFNLKSKILLSILRLRFFPFNPVF